MIANPQSLNRLGHFLTADCKSAGHLAGANRLLIIKAGVPWSLSRLMTHPLSVCFKTILQIEPQTKLQVEIQLLILEGIFYIASVVEVILGARLNV